MPTAPRRRPSKGSAAADSLLGLDLTTFTHGTTSTAYYLRDPLGHLLGDNVNGTHHYYLHDAIGSIIGVVSSSGVLVGTSTYDPWGRVTATSGTAYTPWGYAGGYDVSNGLVKFGTRYYDPELGRFTQRDPAHQGNPYAYANDNPINFTDPTGAIPSGEDILNALQFAFSLLGVFVPPLETIIDVGNFAVDIAQAIFSDCPVEEVVRAAGEFVLSGITFGAVRAAGYETTGGLL